MIGPKQLVFFVFTPALVSSSLAETITMSSLIKLYVDLIKSLNFLSLKETWVVTFRFWLVSNCLQMAFMFFYVQMVHAGERSSHIDDWFGTWLGAG